MLRFQSPRAQGGESAIDRGRAKLGADANLENVVPADAVGGFARSENAILLSGSSGAFYTAWTIADICPATDASRKPP